MTDETVTVESTRGTILLTANDLGSSFLFYDRKEDEELGVGEIERAILDGEITVDEIVAEFRGILEVSVEHAREASDIGSGPSGGCEPGEVIS